MEKPDFSTVLILPHCERQIYLMSTEALESSMACILQVATDDSLQARASAWGHLHTFLYNAWLWSLFLVEAILHSQAITAAEAAYSRAMTASSRVKLWSEFDGPSLRSALSRLSDVPWLLGEVSC